MIGRGLVAGLALAVAIVACAAPPAARTGLPQRDEILTLWSQIRDWRARSGLRVDPDPRFLNSFPTVVEAKRVCPDDHAVPKTCEDVCGLGEAICDNAERICELAKQLGDDTFAREKCASAKASCHEAKQRCCDCSTEAPEATP